MYFFERKPKNAQKHRLGKFDDHCSYIRSILLGAFDAAILLHNLMNRYMFIVWNACWLISMWKISSSLFIGIVGLVGCSMCFCPPVSDSDPWQYAQEKRSSYVIQDMQLEISSPQRTPCV